MKQQQKIRLYQSRDFSGIFDTSIAFIKQNYGAILKGILVFIPITLIATYLLMNLFSFSNMSMTSIGEYEDDPFAIFRSIFDWRFFLGIFIMMVAGYLISLYPMCYMALYAESKDGTVDSKDVWTKVKQVALPLFGYSIIYGILISAGWILCLIPGLIISVYLSLYFYTYIIERKGLVETFQRSIELVRHHWWISSGLITIFSIIASVIGFVFTLPVYGTMIGNLLGIDFLTSEIYIYLTYSLSYTARMLLSPILIIVLGVMYFSYRSQLDGIGVTDEIDMIGVNKEEDQPIQY